MVFYKKSILIGLVSVGFLIFPPLTFATEVSWDPPSQQCDGTTIPNTGPDSLAAYRIHYNKDSGNPNPISTGCGPRTFIYTNIETVNVDQTTFNITVEEPGTYYVAVTAVNTEGEESSYSNEITITVEESAVPNKPIGFEISLR